MTGRGSLLALWWVRRYTATADPQVREDRRAEVAADVHDQLACARDRGTTAAAADRAVAWRAARGVPADLAWRLGREAGQERLAWHLAHPATLLAGLAGPLVGLGILQDAARERATWLAVPADLAEVALLPLFAVAVAVGVVGGVRAVRRPRRPTLPGARRAALAAMAVTWALSGLWRFAPGVLGVVSTAAWAAFGIALLCWLGTVLLTGVAQVLALGKLSS